MAIQAVLPVLLPALTSILQSKEVAMAGNKLINGMLDIFRPVYKNVGKGAKGDEMTSWENVLVIKR